MLNPDYCVPLADFITDLLSKSDNKTVKDCCKMLCTECGSVFDVPQDTMINENPNMYKAVRCPVCGSVIVTA